MHLHYEAVKHGWRPILDVIYVITEVEAIIIDLSLPLPTTPTHPTPPHFGVFFQKYTAQAQIQVGQRMD